MPSLSKLALCKLVISRNLNLGMFQAVLYDALRNGCDIHATVMSVALLRCALRLQSVECERSSSARMNAQPIMHTPICSQSHHTTRRQLHRLNAWRDVQYMTRRPREVDDAVRD